MKIDKIPPMFDNLHGSVHSEIGPTKRAGKNKFVKNKKKNCCNKKGECGVYPLNTEQCAIDPMDCKYWSKCTCWDGCGMCANLRIKGNECKCEAARKEAGVND